MVVGVLKLTFHITESGSLKEKRRVLRSLKDRLRANFNVAVAEVGSHDLWQAAEIAAVVVSADRDHADEQLQTILGRVESWHLADLIDVQMEII